MYIPDIPLDPLLAQQRDRAFYERRLEAKLQHRSILHLYEERKTGQRSMELAPWISLEVERTSKLLDSMPKGSPGLTTRNSASLQNLFTQLWQFKQQLVSPAALDALLLALQSRTVEAHTREETFQQSMTNFLSRLTNTYGDEFQDIVFLVILASHYIKFGLRVQAQCAAAAGGASLTAQKFLVDFVGSPSSISSLALRSLPISDLKNGVVNANASTVMLARLASGVVEIERGLPLAFHLELVEESFRFFGGEWAILEARAAQEDYEATSLFKRSSQAVNSASFDDATLEELEFRELFPTYEEDPEPVIHPRISPATLTQKNRAGLSVEPFITSLHLAAAGLPLVECPVDSAQDIYERLRGNILSNMYANYIELPLKMEGNSIAFRVSLLASTLRKVQEAPMNRDEPYDFYRDANIPEISKARKVILSFETRLKVLCEEWPEQTILSDLLDRCNRILTMEVQVPVARLLGSIEALLLCSADWENYASRDTSIKEDQLGLTNLIVEWRRLELACWPHLLKIEARQASAAAAKWWFQLYNLIVRGALAIDESSPQVEQSKHKVLLLTSVDVFLSNSPLGEFARRLELVKAFAIYLQLLCQDKKREATHPTVLSASRILNNLCHYYTAFRPAIISTSESKKQPIENDIRESVKLASWKDVNVLALKESARRTHRRLHKSIRQYRQALSLQVSNLGIITSTLDDFRKIPEDAVMSDAPIAMLPRPSHPSSDILFEKYSELLFGCISRSLLSSEHVRLLETWIQSVIAAMKQLQDAKVAAQDVEARRRQQKSLLSQKRRAWSDLLKELKRIGLSPDLRSDIANQITDRLWVFEQPTLDAQLGTSAVDVEKYSVKLLSALPELERGMATHHSDLSTRDLQRGRAFTLNLFSMCIGCRSRYVLRMLLFIS